MTVKTWKEIKLYYHKTEGGAEYLFDTCIECPNGELKGIINKKTKYMVRLDGDIKKDAVLEIRRLQSGVKEEE